MLLLASHNRNYGCGNCCNCCSNIPVPFPIPIPINNPMITTGGNYDYEDEEDDNSNVSNPACTCPADPPVVPEEQ